MINKLTTIQPGKKKVYNGDYIDINVFQLIQSFCYFYQYRLQTYLFKSPLFKNSQL